MAEGPGHGLHAQVERVHVYTPARCTRPIFASTRAVVSSDGAIADEFCSFCDCTCIGIKLNARF